MNWLRIIMLTLMLAVAVPAAAGPGNARVDSSDVVLRQPDAALQKKYYNDKSYTYDRELADEKKSILDKILEWLMKRGDRAVNTTKGRDQTTSVAMIIAILVLVALILVMLGANIRNIFFGGEKKKEEKPDVTISDFELHGTDYAKAIAEAEARKDYRSAVRLWFLRSLKQLTDKDMIFFRSDKTNFDYYTELRGTEHQPAFREISLIYDYIWYGEFSITESQYQEASAIYSKFSQRIGT